MTQTTKSNAQNDAPRRNWIRFGHWVIGVLNLFVIWDLVLGAFAYPTKLN